MPATIHEFFAGRTETMGDKPKAEMASVYKLGLRAATGTVNTASCRGFDPGEVLFLGASGTRKGLLPTDPWEITFTFAAQKNQAGLTAGGITDIA